MRSSFLSLWAYGGACAIGSGLVLYVFPQSFLFPPSLQTQALEGDMAQHVIGQRYFIADAWRWPLLTARNLNTPEGVNIAFTDSIPLMALILKLLAGLLPSGFHGVGLWYGLSWLLQPVAGVWCIRAAGERRLLPALCMAVVVISVPAWWARYGHAALTGHFLLLTGLGAYFVLVRHGGTLRWLAVGALQAGALLTHPYLWLMTMSLLTAVPVTLGLRHRRGWRGAAVGWLLIGLACLLAMYTLGYLGTRAPGGFGRYGLNVLSPFWPAHSWLMPVNLARVDARGSDGWEGYNYLGAGVLLGVVLVALLNGRWIREGLRRHPGLVLVLLGLTVMALSNEIAIGNRVVVNLYRPLPILEQTRGSARFFWPVAYALALGVMVGLARLPRRAIRAVLLLGVTGLQFVDATRLRDGLSAHLAYAVKPWTIDAEALRPIFAAHRSLTLLPRWFCMPSEDVAGQQAMELEVLALASETALPANTMYVARWRRLPRCNDQALARAPLRSGEIRVLLPSVRDVYAPLVPDSARICRPVGTLTVCGRSEAPSGAD